MRIVILAGTVYNATEKQYKDIKAFERKMYENHYHPEMDLEMHDYLEKMKPKLELLGDVDFDFRL